MKTWSALLISMFMMSPVVQANAQNYPCSKSMGGVSHCKDGGSWRFAIPVRKIELTPKEVGL